MPAESSSTEPTTRLQFPDHLPSIEFSSPEAAKNCGISTALALEMMLSPTVTATGTVGYDQSHFAQLSVRVPGIVWRVEKRIGDLVKRGELLAIIDSAEVGNAKAALLEAAVLHNLNTLNLKNLNLVRGSVPEREVRHAEADVEVSQAKRFNAVQKLANLGFPIRLEDIEKLSADELSEKLLHLGLPKSLFSETASANLMPLIAPFDGIITACDIVQGEIVEPSQVPYTIVDTRKMWINLHVRQEDAVRLILGAPIEFEGSGDLQSISGTLTWIGTEVDPRTRTVRARAEVENPLIDSQDVSSSGRRALQANVFGTAQIRIGKETAAVVVPNEALHWQWEIGHEIVFIAAEDQRHFEPRIVGKGRVEGEFSEVLTGLRAGERVVTAGSRILSSELSDRLQSQLGDNAAAVREFDKGR